MKRRISAALLGVLVVGFALLLWIGHEPRYHGFSLSECLAAQKKIYSGQLTIPGWQDSRNAVREIGTNALPFLVRWICYERRPWRDKALTIFDKLPRTPVNKYLRPIIDGERAKRNAEYANLGFEILGPIAAPAVPDLQRLAADNSLCESGLRAMQALVSIGKEGLPALTAIAIDPRATNRLQAISAIGRSGTNASVPMTMLLQLLKDPNADVARAAATTLGNLRLWGESVIPALIESLDNPSYSVRQSAAYALSRFGPAARTAVPALLNLLAVPDWSVRSVAAYALGEIAPDPDVLENVRPEAEIFK